MSWDAGSVEHLRRLATQRAMTEAAIRAEVAHLRQQEAPWSVIADALGISRQAAHERYRATRVSLEDRPLPNE